MFVFRIMIVSLCKEGVCYGSPEDTDISDAELGELLSQNFFVVDVD